MQRLLINKELIAFCHYNQSLEGTQTQMYLTVTLIYLCQQLGEIT